MLTIRKPSVNPVRAAVVPRKPVEPQDMSEDGIRQLLSDLCPPPIVRAFFVCNGFHAVEHTYLSKGVLRTLPVMVQSTVKVSPAMRPATQNRYPVELVQRKPSANPSLTIRSLQMAYIYRDLVSFVTKSLISSTERPEP